MNRLVKQRLGIALGVLVPLIIWAGDLVLPHTFSAGGAIRADEMNANFAAVRAHASRAFMSGTRLKALGIKSADGTSVPIGPYAGAYFWDAQLQTLCAPSNSSPPFKCLPPTARLVVYLDAACTQPAVRAADYGALGFTRPSAFSSVAVGSNVELRRLGTPTAVTRFYRGLGSSRQCGAANCAGCCDALDRCVNRPSNGNNTTCGSQGAICNDCMALGNVCVNEVCVGGGTPVASACAEVVENAQLQAIGAVEPMTSFADVEFGEL